MQARLQTQAQDLPRIVQRWACRTASLELCGSIYGLRPAAKILNGIYSDSERSIAKLKMKALILFSCVVLFGSVRHHCFPGGDSKYGFT